LPPPFRAGFSFCIFALSRITPQTFFFLLLVLQGHDLPWGVPGLPHNGTVTLVRGQPQNWRSPPVLCLVSANQNLVLSPSSFLFPPSAPILPVPFIEFCTHRLYRRFSFFPPPLCSPTNRKPQHTRQCGPLESSFSVLQASCGTVPRGCIFFWSLSNFFFTTFPDP